MNLRSVARALGGEVSGRAVRAPCPGHSGRDRSLAVSFSPDAPDGFLVSSFAGDDWRDCKDHVRRLTGLERKAESRRMTPEPDDREEKIAAALFLWAAAGNPRNTIAERYLNSRSLDLGDDVAGDVLRWHPGIGAMIGLFRNIETDKPQAISRTFIDRDGNKLGRKFLGPVGGAAIKLDADETVLGGLHIGEGICTCMAARQIGLRPVWACGSCSAIERFPVLPGIETLSIICERDEANRRAAIACVGRWNGAGKEVLGIWSNCGNDLNDALLGRAA